MDTIEQGIKDLHIGSSYCEPDSLILNPSDWSLIRRTKDSYGRYLLKDPGQSEVSNLWGIPVVTTTQIATRTGVLANFQIAAQAYLRQGVAMEMTNSSGTDFESGRVKVRATERLTLGIARPSAINIITGIA